MKLKKQVKVVIVLILLGGIGFGFYSFNHWFFSKYNIKDVNIEEKKEGNDKEIVPEEEQNKEDVINKTLNTSKTNEKKVRASEIYYCSDGDILDGKECITKVEVNALKVQVEDNREYYEVVFNYDTIANEYQISREDAKSVIQEVCEVELKGTFKPATNEGSCIFTMMEEDKTFYYMCLDSTYTLKGDKCIKNEKISAKVRYGCKDGYVLDGIYCQEK